MAYRTTIFCPDCGESKEVLVPSSGPRDSRCYECREIAKEKERLEYFAELDALPLEERIRRIEEWIYYYQVEYVAPPRY